MFVWIPTIVLSKGKIFEQHIVLVLMILLDMRNLAVNHRNVNSSIRKLYKISCLESPLNVKSFDLRKQNPGYESYIYK